MEELAKLAQSPLFVVGVAVASIIETWLLGGPLHWRRVGRLASALPTLAAGSIAAYHPNPTVRALGLLGTVFLIPATIAVGVLLWKQKPASDAVALPLSLDAVPSASQTDFVEIHFQWESAFTAWLVRPLFDGTDWQLRATMQLFAHGTIPDGTQLLEWSTTLSLDGVEVGACGDKPGELLQSRGVAFTAPISLIASPIGGSVLPSLSRGDGFNNMLISAKVILSLQLKDKQIVQLPIEAYMQICDSRPLPHGNGLPTPTVVAPSVVARPVGVSQVTGSDGGYRVEIETTISIGSSPVQIAWFALEWKDGASDSHPTRSQPPIEPLIMPFTLERTEVHRVAFSVPPVWRSRGVGRLVVMAGGREERSPWFAMNPTCSL